MIEVIDIEEKFSIFEDYWSPHLIGNVNDCAVKIAKFHGAFDWHAHEQEDELFLVVQGEITIELRDRVLQLEKGQMVIIPKGVEHKPSAAHEAWVLMFEPQTTLNTGDNIESDKTAINLPRI